MSTNASESATENLSTLPQNEERSNQAIRFRLLGLIPLILFLARLRDLIELGEVGHILWMCHLSNVILALGLFLACPLLVRISIPWLVFGLPLWIWDMTQMGVIGGLTSFGTHIGGLLVGLFAVSRMRYDRKSWLYALIYYLVVQQVCRMITPVELNVNIAHKIYYGWETMFSAYWQYWLVTTITAAVFLWVIGFLLMKLFPPKG
jgi:hypothetical protein